MKWTKEQQKIIDTRGKNILVSAAAGSGKTAVLVERIKELIVKDRVPLKSMLIVTFTNAAAGEMKQRIIDSINKELAENEDEFIRDQIQNIYNTHISTFHSFAISILKRYYHIAGIEPSFNICPENQLEVYKNEALDILLDEHFQKQDPDFLGFMKNYATSKNENAVRSMILTTFDFIQNLPDSEKWLSENVDALKNSPAQFKDSNVFKILKSQIKYNLNRSISKNRTLMEILKESDVTSLYEKAAIDHTAIKGLLDTLENQSFEIFLSNLQELTFQRFTSKKDEKEQYETIKLRIQNLRKEVKSHAEFAKRLFPDGRIESKVSEVNETYKDAKVLASLVRDFERIFSEIKGKEDVLDFGDVEHLALKILGDNQVASEYQEKFEYIFIDEYQDSNFIQEAFINRIKRENNLFMVGDVKQSIYKFRRAEPSIFLEKYETYSGGSHSENLKIDLNKNFRSKKNIIECINNVFVHVMEESISNMKYDEQSFLYKGLEYEGKWDIPVDLYVVDSGKLCEEDDPDHAINEIKDAELEAHEIAEIIKKEVGSPIFDVKKGQTRNLEYRDIVILLRTVKNNASVIYETLMNHGIPTFAEGGEDYFSTVEIETFLNLLRVIDNRRQDVPLVSTMFSPIFGFTTEELIKIRLMKKKGTYYSAFLEYMEAGSDEDLRIKCIDMNNRISAWKRDEAFMALDDFLWKLMNESGYYNYAGALIGGVQRRANLRALIDRASDYSIGKIRGLFGFINYVDTIKQNDIKMGQIKLLSENDNVVRIMSVHKSKGLEYPYVIAARLGKTLKRKNNDTKVRLNKDLGLGLQWESYDLRAYKQTLITEIIKEQGAIEDLAEELRILYVAMTRAMDKLVLIGSINSQKQEIEEILDEMYEADLERDFDIKSAISYMHLLLPLAKEIGIKPKLIKREGIFERLDTGKESLRAGEEIREKINNIKIPKETNIDLNGQIRSSADQEINRRLNYEYPYKEALSLKSKYSVTQLNNINNQPAKIMTYGLGEDRLSKLKPAFLADEIPMTAAEKGTVLHTVFEKLNFKDAIEKKGDPDYIDDFIRSLAEQKILSKEEASSVNRTAVSVFINSQIIKRAANSQDIQKERPFNILTEIHSEPVMVQGIMDCYFLEDGEYVLLDYKSNYVDRNKPGEKERLAALYREQINLYRSALEQTTGIRVKEAFLYLTGIGDTVLID